MIWWWNWYVWAHIYLHTQQVSLVVRFFTNDRAQSKMLLLECQHVACLTWTKCPRSPRNQFQEYGLWRDFLLSILIWLIMDFDRRTSHREFSAKKCMWLTKALPCHKVEVRILIWMYNMDCMICNKNQHLYHRTGNNRLEHIQCPALRFETHFLKAEKQFLPERNCSMRSKP